MAQTISYLQSTLDPYVPKFTKDIANFGINTIQSGINTTSNIVSSSINLATSTVNNSVSFAKNTTVNTVNYAQNTVKASVLYAQQSAHAAQSFAQSKATNALVISKVAVSGATTTITTYTPEPVLNFIQATLNSANALRLDPIGTVKPYVPTFVINIGEKSFEIVANVHQANVRNLHATTGFIVTKVNGTTEYITSVPMIASVIEKLQTLTAPLLSKIHPADKKITEKEL